MYSYDYLPMTTKLAEACSYIEVRFIEVFHWYCMTWVLATL